MGIDAKDIQIFVLKAVKFSVSTCFRFVQKYPVGSSVFSFLFFLYFFLPSVFYFLLYSFPFVVCTLVFIHFYFISKRHGIQNAAKSEETRHVRQAPLEKPEADVVMINRDVNFPVKSRSIKGKDKDCDVQASKDMIVKNSPTDDLIGENFLIEEKSSVVTVDKRTSCYQNDSDGETNLVLSNSTSSEVDQASKMQGGGEVDIESSSSGEDEDEEAQKDTNKAVEWTEDDQKNLMDLGISELERNKRLESLIARRRARKSKNPIQKSLNMSNAHPLAPVAHVLIARTNPFDVPSSSEPTPGSAPSVLLQTRNPFDLPYDPLEEKPDLTADSFQQEFMPAHQKDMFFCRHESFLLGPSFPALDCFQDQYEGLGFSRVKRTSDNGGHDRVIGDPLFSGGEPLRRTISVTDLVTEEGESFEQALNKAEVSGEANNDEKIENTNDIELSLASGNEVQKAIDLAKQKKNGSSSSGSDDDDDQEAIFNGNTIGITENIHMTGFEFPEVFHNPTHTPLPCPIPKGRVIGDPTYDSLPSPVDKSRAEELSFLGTKASWHTPSNSIASDMQVEVSELGSPPSTEDGTGSSNDGDSLTYEGDIDKEITSGSEEIWGVSPCAPKLDQDQLVSKQVYDDSEEAATRERLSYIQKELDNPVASFMRSLPSSTEEEPPEVHRAAEAVDNKTPNSSDTVELGNSSEGKHLMTEPINHEFVEMPREPFNLSDNLTEEVKENSGVEDMKLVEVGINGNERCFNERSLIRDELAEHSKLAEESKPESVNAAGHKSLSSPEKPEEEGIITHIENEPVVNVNDHIEDLKSKENRDVETGISNKREVIADLSETTQEKASEFNDNAKSNSGEPANNQTTLRSMTNKYEDNQDIPNPLDGENVSLSNCDSEEQESNREAALSGLSQMSNNSTTQLDLLVEEVSTNSSTSDSPKSVLPDISPRDQIASSVFTQQMNIPVSESDHQGEVRNGFIGEHVDENAGLVTPENTQEVIDTSIHRPLVSGSETSEEPPDTPDNEANHVNSLMNRPVLVDEEVKEDARSIETTNADSAAELSGPPVEINPRSTEPIESNPIANPDDISGEEVVNYLLSQSPAANSEISNNVNEPLTSEITSNENLTSPGKSADGEHDSNTLNRPEAVTEQSNASEATSSEPRKDNQNTMKESKEDAVNDVPLLPVEDINSSTDHTMNFEDHGKFHKNETDADKSGEANDNNSKFIEEVKGDRDQIEAKKDLAIDSNTVVEPESKPSISDASNGHT